MKRSFRPVVDCLEDRCVPTVDPLTTVVSVSQVASASVATSGPTLVSLNSIGNQSNLVGDVVKLTLSATSSDGAALTFTATGLPNGLSIDPTTGVISGTVAAGAVHNNVIITATDPAANTSASVTMNWTVKTPLLFVANPGDQGNAVGDAVNVQVFAGATDGAALTFAGTGLPDGLTIDPNSGIISGTVASDAVAGVVKVTVTDPTTNVSATLTFNWNINQAGTPPTPTVAQGEDDYVFVIDIPINDPNAVPPSTGQTTNPTTNPGNPWAIYGWDSIPLIPPIGAPLWF